MALTSNDQFHQLSFNLIHKEVTRFSLSNKSSSR